MWWKLIKFPHLLFWSKTVNYCKIKHIKWKRKHLLGNSTTFKIQDKLITKECVKVTTHQSEEIDKMYPTPLQFYYHQHPMKKLSTIQRWGYRTPPSEIDWQIIKLSNCIRILHNLIIITSNANFLIQNWPYYNLTFRKHKPNKLRRIEYEDNQHFL